MIFFVPLVQSCSTPFTSPGKLNIVRLGWEGAIRNKNGVFSAFLFITLKILKYETLSRLGNLVNWHQHTICSILETLGAFKAPIFLYSESVPNSPMWGYSEHPRSIKKMGALKAPKVSKIERIVCWCHFTRLPKLDKVSYFKIVNVINKKAEKTPFLFRIAPPHLCPISAFSINSYSFFFFFFSLWSSV